MNFLGFQVTRTKASLSPISDNRGGWWPIIREGFAGAFQRDIEWTVDSVLAHHAVYACVTLISSDIGKLRPKLVEMDRDGIWTETSSSAFSPVLRKPNRFQNRIQFIEWWITSKLLRGNAYALKERDERGVVRRLYLLDPTRVQVLVSPDGSVFYQLKVDNISGIKAEMPAVPASEIIHDRMNCLFHPLVGTSPIYACGTAASMGLTIERNSFSFFDNGSNASGILSSPLEITPKKAEELSTVWNAQFGGKGSGGVAVLGNGMKFERMRMSAVDSQLIEQLKWTAEVVCSTFHVPAWKVGVGQQPAYTKPEIADQAYYSNCLQSLIEQFELCMDEGLGLDEAKEGKLMGVELDLDGLLRMDKASQVTTLVEGIRGGLLTPNGARRKVDEKPVKGGDTIWLQQQDVPIEVAYENAINPPKPPPAPEPPAPEPPADKDADIEEREAVLYWKAAA